MFCPFRNTGDISKFDDCRNDCGLYIKELESCSFKYIALSFNALLTADDEPEQEPESDLPLPFDK